MLMLSVPSNVMSRVTIGLNVVAISRLQLASLYWFYKKTRLARKPSANGLVLPLFLRYSHRIGEKWKKMAHLDIPDCIYNWLVDFFNEHSHHTKYGEQTSTLKTISASIIQGSAIGPA